MRMNLVDSVAFLQLAHDAVAVCEAASQTDDPCSKEIASVLGNSVAYRVDMQIRTISSIIKQSGGSNSFTEGHDATARDAPVAANNQPTSEQIPQLQSDQDRINVIRKQLEDLFDDLHIVAMR